MKAIKQMMCFQYILYDFIYEMRAGRHEDIHVSGHNLITEHAMKLSYGILDCPWIGLYDAI